jgi:hypothetical protein
MTIMHVWIEWMPYLTESREGAEGIAILTSDATIERGAIAFGCEQMYRTDLEENEDRVNDPARP